MASIIYLSTAKKSLLNDAAERLSLVWRDFVAVVEGVGGDEELVIGVPDDQISIGAGGDKTFSRLERDLSRRIRA